MTDLNQTPAIFPLNVNILNTIIKSQRLPDQIKKTQIPAAYNKHTLNCKK